MTALLVPEAPTILKRAAIPDALRDWQPTSLLGISVLKALPYLPQDLALELKERVTSAGIMESRLALRHFDARGRLVEDHGVVCRKVVTTVGVGYIVDAFQNSVELELMKYHGIGQTNTAENVSNTALVAELTTQYSTDNTRATGSLTENGANVFRTVGTNQVDAIVAIVEHGIFSSATVAAGVLLDRSIFASIGLTSGESLESTYDLTFTAGS